MRKDTFGCGLIEICLAVSFILLVIRLIGLEIPWLIVAAPIWAPAAFMAIIITASILIGAARDRREQKKRRKWDQ